LTELEQRVCRVVAADLGISHVELADDLSRDYGADEIALLGVAMRLEEAFLLRERSVSEEALIVDSTVSKCVELVSGAALGNQAA
jgi:hypothetical protein